VQLLFGFLELVLFFDFLTLAIVDKADSGRL
jgi:hypothetical protein